MITRKVAVPDGVEVKIDGKKVSVKGPKGEVFRNFGNPAFNRYLEIKKEGSEVSVSSSDDGRKLKAMVGTIEALFKKMFIGVTKGYKFTLKIYFVHFPISVETKESKDCIEVSVKNFLGEKKPRKAKINGVKMKVAGEFITITGADSEKVGNAGARMEQITKVRNRDRRVFNDGIFPVSKGLDD